MMFAVPDSNWIFVIWFLWYPSGSILLLISGPLLPLLGYVISSSYFDEKS